jgi:hypothetical protein
VRARELAIDFGNPVAATIETFRVPGALYLMIDYIHNNPVRRGLVANPEDWEWSSARWYGGMRPGKIEMDLISPDDIPS